MRWTIIHPSRVSDWSRGDLCQGLCQWQWRSWTWPSCKDRMTGPAVHISSRHQNSSKNTLELTDFFWDISRGLEVEHRFFEKYSSLTCLWFRMVVYVDPFWNLPIWRLCHLFLILEFCFGVRLLGIQNAISLDLRGSSLHLAFIWGNNKTSSTCGHSRESNLSAFFDSSANQPPEFCESGSGDSRKTGLVHHFILCGDHHELVLSKKSLYSSSAQNKHTCSCNFALQITNPWKKQRPSRQNIDLTLKYLNWSSHWCQQINIPGYGPPHFKGQHKWIWYSVYRKSTQWP